MNTAELLSSDVVGDLLFLPRFDFLATLNLTTLILDVAPWVAIICSSFQCCTNSKHTLLGSA